MKKGVPCIFLVSLVFFFAQCTTVPNHPFTDIGNSPYAKDIAGVYNRGYIDEAGGAFRPAETMSRAEAASLIQRAFLISPITTVSYPDRPDLRRERVYAGNLGVVTEAFTVSTAIDSAAHRFGSSIEALINTDVVRYDEIKEKG
jgi:hypothetical protein